MFTLTITESGINLNALADEIPDNVIQPLVEAVGDSAYMHAIQNAPFRTGALMGSIEKVIGNLSVQITPTVSYANFVEFGTGPHLIAPVNGKVLKFESMGKTIFSKYARHPGTTPNPFMARAVDQTIEEISDIFISIFEQSLKTET